ncbi:hypothetical protein DSAG12_02797 [Promethearchaeum syntrophicum]|uniref:Uncharacterized protein n=1 Tax=Promethearchaeum syntrophicum TaxID=2594042 RepID=A0A5B9DE08_9ARCH|nr:hypothetical protein [Candidatus Prometheoarchaeum syntrophicum]QEE16966.1 hypothetical protein DSAG12_02797 [Candidatus Prometheoarchaeum syntrophicum]
MNLFNGQEKITLKAQLDMLSLKPQIQIDIRNLDSSKIHNIVCYPKFYSKIVSIAKNIPIKSEIFPNRTEKIYIPISFDKEASLEIQFSCIFSNLENKLYYHESKLFSFYLRHNSNKKRNNASEFLNILTEFSKTTKEIEYHGQKEDLQLIFENSFHNLNIQQLKNDIRTKLENSKLYFYRLDYESSTFFSEIIFNVKKKKLTFTIWAKNLTQSEYWAKKVFSNFLKEREQINQLRNLYSNKVSASYHIGRDSGTLINLIEVDWYNLPDIISKLNDISTELTKFKEFSQYQSEIKNFKKKLKEIKKIDDLEPNLKEEFINSIKSWGHAIEKQYN